MGVSETITRYSVMGNSLVDVFPLSAVSIGGWIQENTVGKGEKEGGGGSGAGRCSHLKRLTRCRGMVCAVSNW